MYPDISIGNWIHIYTFWLCLTIAWALFFVLLHQFSILKWLSKKNIFTESIISFTLSVFIFSRVFYIIGNWVDDKFLIKDVLFQWQLLEFLRHFFITDNYNLSFAGGVFGFLLIFFWKTWYDKKVMRKYWDIVVPAFLIAGILGYLWAFLGGQLYGTVTSFPLSITYSSKVVPLRAPTFPLPIIYIIICSLLSLIWYRLDKKTRLPDGVLGYGLMGVFFILVFIFEFWNGSSDIFSSKVGINLSQIIAIVMTLLALVWTLRVAKS